MREVLNIIYHLSSVTGLNLVLTSPSFIYVALMMKDENYCNCPVNESPCQSMLCHVSSVAVGDKNVQEVKDNWIYSIAKPEVWKWPKALSHPVTVVKCFIPKDAQSLESSQYYHIIILFKMTVILFMALHCSSVSFPLGLSFISLLSFLPQSLSALLL